MQRWAYDFFTLLDAGLNLRNVPLRLIIRLLLNLILSYYAKRRFGV